VLVDGRALGDAHQGLSWRELTWLQLFDGQRTLREIQIEALHQEGGQLLSIDLFRALVDKLDNALFLESPRYREFLASPIREPSCIGCYHEEPDGIRKQLEGLFTGPRGPGLPPRRKPNGELRGAVLPPL